MVNVSDASSAVLPLNTRLQDGVADWPVLHSMCLLQLLQQGLLLAAEGLRHLNTWSALVLEMHNWKLSQLQPQPHQRVTLQPLPASTRASYIQTGQAPEQPPLLSGTVPAHALVSQPSRLQARAATPSSQPIGIQPSSMLPSSPEQAASLFSDRSGVQYTRAISTSPQQAATLGSESSGVQYARTASASPQQAALLTHQQTAVHPPAPQAATLRTLSSSVVQQLSAVPSSPTQAAPPETFVPTQTVTAPADQYLPAMLPPSPSAEIDSSQAADQHSESVCTEPQCQALSQEAHVSQNVVHHSGPAFSPHIQEASSLPQQLASDRSVVQHLVAVTSDAPPADASAVSEQLLAEESNHEAKSTAFTKEWHHSAGAAVTVHASAAHLCTCLPFLLVHRLLLSACMAFNFSYGLHFMEIL